MQEAMDQVVGRLFIWFFGASLERDFRADDAFAEKVFVDGECHAVSGGRIIKKLSMNLCDFTCSNKVDRDVRAVNFLLTDDKVD